MLTTLYYCFQVILCSTIMIGYYWLVLRDKKFHQYNRFYLMAITLLSWIVPLIKIQWQQPVEADSTMYYLLSSVASNNTDIDVTLQSKWYNLNWQALLTVVYAAVSLVLLSGMVTALIRIYRLLKNNSCKTLGEVFVVLTNANGTPFSFFSYIFWNDEIDLKSDAGKQMLKHELTHVKQKHSIDKILIQIVLIVGWFNPFFWLIKKEMDMIHEFIADQHTIKNGDAASLAEMLLTALYPQKKYLLANPFFFSPIKRRIQMIKNNSTPKYSYMRRLIILPLLAIVVVLFAFRNKENAKPISMGTLIENFADVVKNEKEKYTGKIQLKPIALKQSYTIVINPGHGGADKGAIGVDRKTTEAALTLSLAKTIKEINANDQINIVLTRDEDVYQSVVEVSDFANQQKADLFVSLHYNAASPVKDAGKPSKENPTNGSEIYLYPNSIFNQNNYLLANAIANKINQLEIPFKGIKTRKEGIYVLKNSNTPSVLLEAGYVSNTKDLTTIKETGFQKDLAASILNGIQQYLLAKENSVNGNDTIILNSDSVYILPKGNNQIIIDKNRGVYEIENYKSVNGEDKKVTYFTPKSPEFENMVFLVDGIEMDWYDVTKISPDKLATINISRDIALLDKYGKRAKNGVMLISTKRFAIDKNNFKEKFLKIDLKGSSNAVYFLDGKKVDNSILSEMSPNAIKSINVLKGQSAIALYGEEGKNGVVEINTIRTLSDNKNVDAVKPKSLYIVDGKLLPLESFAAIHPSNIKNMTVINGEDAIKIYGNGAKDGIVFITTRNLNTDVLDKNESNFEKIIGNQISSSNKFNAKTALQIIDGKIMPSIADGFKMERNSIIVKSKILESDEAIKKYGNAAKDGAVEMITRKNTDAKIEKIDNSSENQAITVQGFKLEPVKSNANNSVTEKIKSSNPSIKNVFFYEGSRRLNIQFKDGSEEIYNLESTESRNKAEKKYGIKLATPSSKDEKYDKVFSVTQVPASFPGGKEAWQKYLERNLNKNIPVEKGAPAGKYTVIVDFIVKMDGTLADIKTANNPGYGTAEEAMRMISKGPNWMPATQNGKPVIYRVKQSITFQISED